MTPKNLMSYVAQVGILLAALAGFVLTLAHHGDANSYLGAVLPAIAGLGILARVEARSDKQDQALTQITAQTNGVLDGRIRDGVRAVLAEGRVLLTAMHNTPDAPLPDPVPAAHDSTPAPVAAPFVTPPAPLPDTPAPVAAPLPVGFVETLADAVAEALAHRSTGTGQGA